MYDYGGSEEVEAARTAKCINNLTFYECECNGYCK